MPNMHVKHKRCCFAELKFFGVVLFDFHDMSTLLTTGTLKEQWPIQISRINLLFSKRVTEDKYPFSIFIKKEKGNEFFVFRQDN